MRKARITASRKAGEAARRQGGEAARRRGGKAARRQGGEAGQEDELIRAHTQRLLIVVTLDRIADVGSERNVDDIGKRERVELREGERDRRRDVAQRDKDAELQRERPRDVQQFLDEPARQSRQHTQHQRRRALHQRLIDSRDRCVHCVDDRRRLAWTAGVLVGDRRE
jgi:hypothetical protein